MFESARVRSLLTAQRTHLGHKVRPEPKLLLTICQVTGMNGDVVNEIMPIFFLLIPTTTIISVTCTTATARKKNYVCG